MMRSGGSWLEGGLRRDLSFLCSQTFTGISMDEMDTVQGLPHASALKANGEKKTRGENESVVLKR